MLYLFDAPTIFVQALSIILGVGLICSSSPSIIFIGLELISVFLLLTALLQSSSNYNINLRCLITYLVPNSLGSLIFFVSVPLLLPFVGLSGLIINLGVAPLSFWLSGSSGLARCSPSPFFFIWCFLYSVNFPLFLILPKFFSCYFLLFWAVLAVLAGGVMGLLSNTFIEGFVCLSISSSSSLLILTQLLSSIIDALFFVFVYGLALFLVLQALAIPISPEVSSATVFVILSGLPPGPFFFVNLLNLSLLGGSLSYELIGLLIVGDFVSWGAYLKVCSRLSN